MIPLLAWGMGAMATAAIIQIDISPTGGALSTTNYLANQDHAVGLSGRNEAPPNPSPASGNEVGLGILYDNVTKVLSLNLAYGSVFGFTDLAGVFTAAHIHQGASNFPAPNTAGPVLINLGGIHTPAGPVSGVFSGAFVLTGAQETALMNNLLYINIHSTVFPGGEIRGQLVPVPEPAAALLGLLGAGLSLRRRR